MRPVGADGAPPDVDIIDGRIAGTPTVEVAADTTVAVAEMGPDVIIVGAAELVTISAVAVAMGVDVTIVVIGDDIDVASGEDNVPNSGSNSEYVSPAARAVAASTPLTVGGTGRAVPTIIVPFVLWTW